MIITFYFELQWVMDGDGPIESFGINLRAQKITVGDHTRPIPQPCRFIGWWFKADLFFLVSQIRLSVDGGKLH